MSTLAHGVQSKNDAILLLKMIDGQSGADLGESDVDDFMSVSHDDSLIESCRVRVRDELIDLLTSRDPKIRAKISPLINEMIQSLEGSAG